MHKVSGDILLLSTDVGLGLCFVLFQKSGNHFQSQSFLLNENILECIFLGVVNVDKPSPVYCRIRNLTFAVINCSSPYIAVDQGIIFPVPNTILKSRITKANSACRVRPSTINFRCTDCEIEFKTCTFIFIAL